MSCYIVTAWAYNLLIWKIKYFHLINSSGHASSWIVVDLVHNFGLFLCYQISHFFIFDYPLRLVRFDWLCGIKSNWSARQENICIPPQDKSPPPANTRHWLSVSSMLGHRLQRRPNIELALSHCLMFATRGTVLLNCWCLLVHIFIIW